MKYQSLFSGKNKKNMMNFSSAELAQRTVKVKLQMNRAEFLDLASFKLMEVFAITINILKLALKAPITTAADDILKYFYIISPRK